MAYPIPTRLSKQYSPAAGRKFAFTVGAAFLVLFAIARLRGHPDSSVVLGALAIPLIIAGIVIPAKLGPVERAWMGVAKTLAKVTTPIFMGVVYFGILTPIALLRRLGGSGLVQSCGELGYWCDRRQSPPSSMERQF